MALDAKAKDFWIGVQKKHPVPVNAFGKPIQDNPQTLKIWKEEGIDKHIKKA